MLLAGYPFAFALNPALDVSQYAHTSWKVRDGFRTGAISSIAQTPDGYLWLGTEFGLLRFDGVRAVPWQPPPGQHLPSSRVFSLLAARDGTLWIGTAKGLASWKGGMLTQYPVLAGQAIRAPILEDHEGTVWVGGLASSPPGKLCTIQKGSVQCYGENGALGNGVSGLYEDRNRNLWVGVRNGLWRWKPGPPKFFPAPGPAANEGGIQGLAESDDGALLFGPRSGIRRLVGDKTEAYPLPGTVQQLTTTRLVRDRDGNLWIGTSDGGLVHVHRGRTDVFAQAGGLSGDFITALFVDREGTIWVATLDGLDRFRELAVPTISLKQGLSNATVKSVLAARDGSVWLGTNDGLNRWNNGRVTVYRKTSAKAITGSGLPDDFIESLFEDYRGQIWASSRLGVAVLKDGRFTSINSVPGEVHCIAGDRAGNLWISQEESLFHLRDGMVVERIPWATLGRPDGARGLIVDPSGDGLWLAFRNGGVGYFKDGQVRASYGVADGLGWGSTREFQLGRDGAIWVSTEGGASRLKDGRIATLSSRNGLPCDPVTWMMEDDDHFWLNMGCGLVRIARAELDAWAATADKDPGRRVQATVFDISDGVRSHLNSTGYGPSVAKSADGKLWFLPWDGVSVIDPRHLPFNKLAPPVHIEQITADRKTYSPASDASGHLRLPPLVRDLEIDYTALSLVAPEKVLFRYKLEGWDRDWQEVGNRRQALYSNLPPRAYRFRVAACNNSGVWNETGTFLDFSVAPVFYQTRWFRFSCVAAFLALLGALYQVRLRQLAQQFNMRLEERVSERTRIARDFHDTLLQTIQGSKIVAEDALDEHADPIRMRYALESLLEWLGRAVEEGRSALNALRSSTTEGNDLAEALQRAGEECLFQRSIEFDLSVKGTGREMHPIVRDEVYRIGYEAIRNACIHSEASRLSVELSYVENLTLRIRDNGKGIDPDVAAKGKDGHFGLIGMYERASRVRGKLRVSSSPGVRTEVELIVPRKIAFRPPNPGRRSWFEKIRRLL
jgi:signal transduction histidine kinase/ligand-binding sensor domain-containing protein